MIQVGQTIAVRNPSPGFEARVVEFPSRHLREMLDEGEEERSAVLQCCIAHAYVQSEGIPTCELVWYFRPQILTIQACVRWPSEESRARAWRQRNEPGFSVGRPPQNIAEPEIPVNPPIVMQLREDRFSQEIIFQMMDDRGLNRTDSDFRFVFEWVLSREPNFMRVFRWSLDTDSQVYRVISEYRVPGEADAVRPMPPLRPVGIREMTDEEMDQARERRAARIRPHMTEEQREDEDIRRIDRLREELREKDEAGIARAKKRENKSVVKEEKQVEENPTGLRRKRPDIMADDDPEN